MENFARHDPGIEWPGGPYDSAAEAICAALDEIREIADGYQRQSQDQAEEARKWRLRHDNLEEQLEALREAGDLLERTASQYLDTGRGDLDGAILHWLVALASNPASEPEEPKAIRSYFTHGGRQRVDVIVEGDSNQEKSQ